MKDFFLALTLIFSAALTASAQGGPYHFDNFDFADGIRIEKPVQSPPAKGNRRSSRASVLTSEGTTANSSPKTLTALTSMSVNGVSGVSRSLDGFTTGNASVDSFIVESGSRHGVDPVLLYAIMHQE